MLKPVFIQVGLGVSLRRRHHLPAGRGAVGAGRRPSSRRFAVFTLVISILACAVPVRRALRVEPTEALRAGN